MIRVALGCLMLAGCVTAPPVALDVGCLTYGQQRSVMPPLDVSAVSQWVAETDSAMTGSCR